MEEPERGSASSRTRQGTVSINELRHNLRIQQDLTQRWLETLGAAAWQKAHRESRRTLLLAAEECSIWLNESTFYHRSLL